METLTATAMIFLTIAISASTADYLVVVDAGSSHTSFFLYSGSSTSHELHQLNECYLSGGLDEYAYKLDRIPIYLSECIYELYDLLGREIMSTTPLYMAGTAGLRLLADVDPATANNLLDYMRLIFSATNFIFQPENVGIMTGAEEGIYSLISINMIGRPEEHLGYGVLEMGGASSQIAYKCDEYDTSDCVNYNVLGTNQRLYSQSNLCYGSEEAIKRFVALQILNGFEASGRIAREIHNPCLADTSDGDFHQLIINFPVRKADIFDSSCTDLNADWSDFESALAELPDDFEFIHVGNYSTIDECREEINVLLDYDDCVTVFENEEENCFKFENSRPRKQMFALSAYYWNFAEVLGMTKETIDLEHAAQNILHVCEADPDKNLDCFDLLYVLQTLTKGYGFEEEEFTNIRFTDDISGVAVSWSLGYAATKM